MSGLLNTETEPRCQACDHRSQDALDGLALRRLREALPDRTVYDVFYIPEWRAREDDTPPFTVKVWGVGLDPGVSIYGEGATIAEAADKCREALG